MSVGVPARADTVEIMSNNKKKNPPVDFPARTKARREAFKAARDADPRGAVAARAARRAQPNGAFANLSRDKQSFLRYGTPAGPKD